MPIVKPPTALDSLDWSVPSVFLAGSIEMGKAKDWQAGAADRIGVGNRLILNPRREDWDSKWTQDYSNPHFREQVQWELSALDRVENILVHLQHDTLSPITLMEIGLHARHRRMFISCPEGFWRRGNVQTVAIHYRVPLFDDLDTAIDALLGTL